MQWERNSGVAGILLNSEFHANLQTAHGNFATF